MLHHSFTHTFVAGFFLSPCCYRGVELVDFLKDSTPPVTVWPSRIDEIRILHLGKFLDDAKTLKGLLQQLPQVFIFLHFFILPPLHSIASMLTHNCVFASHLDVQTNRI